MEETGSANRKRGNWVCAEEVNHGLAANCLVDSIYGKERTFLVYIDFHLGLLHLVILTFIYLFIYSFIFIM